MYALAVEVLPEPPGSGCIVSAGRGQAYGGTGTEHQDCSDRESWAAQCSAWLLLVAMRDRMSCDDIVIGTGRLLRFPEAGSGRARHLARHWWVVQLAAASDIVKVAVELSQLYYCYDNYPLRPLFTSCGHCIVRAGNAMMLGASVLEVQGEAQFSRVNYAIVDRGQGMKVSVNDKSAT
jgi:hypothetical protein